MQIGLLWWAIFRALRRRDDDNRASGFAKYAVRGGADEEVVKGVMSMGPHHDVGGVVNDGGIDDLGDGWPAHLFGFDAELRIAKAKIAGDFAEAFCAVFFTDRNCLLEVLQRQAVITGQNRWLDDVEEENAVLCHTGEDARSIDHTLRGS